MNQKNYKKREKYLRLIIIFMTIIMIGMSLNFRVVAGNKGRMPVYASFYYDTDEHFTYQNKSEVNYWFLSDIIYLFKGYWSLGDMLMIGGVISIIILNGLVFYNFIRNTSKEKKKKNKRFPYKKGGKNRSNLKVITQNI